MPSTNPKIASLRGFGESSCELPGLAGFTCCALAVSRLDSSWLIFELRFASWITFDALSVLRAGVVLVVELVFEPLAEELELDSVPLALDDGALCFFDGCSAFAIVDCSMRRSCRRLIAIAFSMPRRRLSF